MAKTIITIGREYCTGGNYIAEDVANALGIKLYDKELITMAAKHSGLSEEAVAASEKRHTHSLLYSLYTMGNELPLGDQVFILQSRIIKQLAEEGPCVILGRCGDYVLRERKDVLRVFVYAPKEWRLQYAKTNPLVKAKDEKGIKDEIDKLLDSVTDFQLLGTNDTVGRIANELYRAFIEAFREIVHGLVDGLCDQSETLRRVGELYRDTSDAAASLAGEGGTLTELGYSMTGGENSPYIWVNVGKDSWKFFDKLLKDVNIVGTPGAGFGPSGEGYFRLTSFGDRENTLRAVERIKNKLRF